MARTRASARGPKNIFSPKLLATCLPGKEDQAEIEILDAFLRGGARDIRVVRTRYPGVLLVETPLPADEALRLATSMEMAYVRSVVPLHVLARAELKAIVEASTRLAREMGLKPGVKFAVRCRRRGRALSSSLEVERAVGEAIRSATGAEVNLEEPDAVIRVEVIDDLAGIGILWPRRRPVGST